MARLLVFIIFEVISNLRKIIFGPWVFILFVCSSWASNLKNAILRSCPSLKLTPLMLYRQSCHLSHDSSASCYVHISKCQVIHQKKIKNKKTKTKQKQKTNKDFIIFCVVCSFASLLPSMPLSIAKHRRLNVRRLLTWMLTCQMRNR
jgi:hypothetical protein